MKLILNSKLKLIWTMICAINPWNNDLVLSCELVTYNLWPKTSNSNILLPLWNLFVYCHCYLCAGDREECLSGE